MCEKMDRKLVFQIDSKFDKLLCSRLQIYLEYHYGMLDMDIDIEVNQSLDTCGLSCPLPLLKTKQALNRLETGQVLSIVCTDPGSVRDFEVFSKQSGHQLLDSLQEEGKYYYWFKKA